MITLKKNDTGRLWTDTLKLNGAAIDLAGATVALLIRRAQSPPATRRTAAVVSAAAGTVSYQPVADDVGTPGLFELEWEITFGTGGILTVPSVGYIELTIVDDLG